MSDSAFVLLNGIARGFRDSIVGMVRVYQMDKQQSDEVDSGEGSAGEETPTVLARRRAARKKQAAATSSKDRFVENVLCSLHGIIMMKCEGAFQSLIILQLQKLVFTVPEGTVLLSGKGKGKGKRGFV